ncbi:MAG: helix-turn-helix domain-containing protein [Caulobacteraceae bacterium]
MRSQIDTHLGRRLRKRRKLLGLTQQQIAEACGVRFQQIQKYECGANRISAARLWQIAVTLEVPLDYFFDGIIEGAESSATEVQRQDAVDLMRAYDQLGERPRRRLLDLIKSMGPENDLA